MPITPPPSDTPGDHAGDPEAYDTSRKSWYLWFQGFCVELLAYLDVVAASATAAANAVLTSKVTGPASATANALAKFDGVTGKIVKVSGVVEDASGNVGFGVTPSYRTHAVAATAYVGFWRNSATATGVLLGGDASGGIVSSDSSGTALQLQVGGSTKATFDVSGNLTPGANGTQAFGSTVLRWSQAWVTAGVFNTSDATLKTTPVSFTTREVGAAKALSKEIALYQWLDAVAEKGADRARHHVGLTVQRAEAVLEEHGLDPWRYGFMSHDKWDDVTVDHPATDAVEAVDAVLDDEGNVVTPAVEAVPAKTAWTEVTIKAGQSYAFRYDQLTLFISRGLRAEIEAQQAQIDAQNEAMQMLAERLAKLEAKA